MGQSFLLRLLDVQMNVASRDARPSLRRHTYRTPQGAGPPSVTCIWQMKEGRGGVKVVSTNLDQRNRVEEKDPRVNYCSGSLKAVHVTLVPNEVYLQHLATPEFL